MLGSPLLVRSLEARDIAALRELDRRAHGDQWSRRVFGDEIAEPGRLHLVGEVGGRVIGHASAWHDGSIGRITNVAVDESHSRLGHGRRLFAALLRAMSDWTPLDQFALEVRARNHAAQRLYRRFGFAPVGVKRGFYTTSHRGLGRDAMVMTIDRPLSNSTLVGALAYSPDERLGDPGEAA